MVDAYIRFFSKLYLHRTSEDRWNFEMIRDKLTKNTFRLDENLKFYDTNIDPSAILKPRIGRRDMFDLIKMLTRNYNDLELIKLKSEYRNPVHRN